MVLALDRRVRLVGEVEVVLRDARWWHPRRWVPRRHRYRNLVTNGGRNTMARLLVGASTNYVNYLELGTGTTTPAATDTALATPSTATWKLIGAGSVYSNVFASFEATYGTSEAVDDWTEMALFSGATSTPGSGSLFSRVLTNWTGITGQTKTVTWRILFST